MTDSTRAQQSPTRRFKPWAAGILLVGIGLATAACGTSSTTSAAGHPAPKKTATKTTAKSKFYRQKGTNTLIEGATPYAGTIHLDHYLKSLKAHPHSVNALYNAAVAEFVNSHMSKAISYYKEAIHYAPTNGTLWNNLGNIYNYSQKKPQVALPDYQKAVHYGASNPINWSNLINCEESLKNTAAAKADAVEALKVMPKQPSNSYYTEVVKDLKALDHPATPTTHTSAPAATHSGS